METNLRLKQHLMFETTERLGLGLACMYSSNSSNSNSSSNSKSSNSNNSNMLWHFNFSKKSLTAFSDQIVKRKCNGRYRGFVPRLPHYTLASERDAVNIFK
ncbi:hypothetical protein FHG87_001183 [Trinorchestia longiramus]|nr:hypothetical protein FHG87_001183 [Trinorchestia longiramus]